MRRMRDFSIGHYVAVAIPVLGAAFGIHYLVRHKGGARNESAQVAKPSQLKADASRKVASLMGEKDGDKLSRSYGAESSQADDESPADTFGQTEDGAAGDAAVAQSPSRLLEGAANDAADKGKDCSQPEFRGEAPELTHVTKAEWSVVMNQFHGAKDSLVAWLQAHRKEIPEPTFQLMERQVRSLKIQRPPAADEPDLAWRGVGVYTQGNESEAIVKLGGGFVRLAATHPARARFELTRLVAQSWAPCELGRAGTAESAAAWNPLLKCMGVTPVIGAQSCAEGTYSEAGWAVSTTVAASVADPGCQIRATRDPLLAKCMKTLPLRASRSVAAEARAVPAGHEGHAPEHPESPDAHGPAAPAQKESHS